MHGLVLQQVLANGLPRTHHNGLNPQNIRPYVQLSQFPNLNFTDF
jgi:hypothetical protein